MEDFFFTFGFGHEHEGCYVKISGECWSDARRKMIDKYGIHWAFQYSKEEWINEQGISLAKKHNIKEITYEEPEPNSAANANEH